MQFFTEPVQTRLNISSLQECPKHVGNNHCELCGKRQSDEPCNCEMCESYNRKLEQEKTSKMTLHLANKMFQKLTKRKLTSKHFQDILHFLLYPHHKTIIYPLGVFIPQICFYKDGEAEALYCNGETNQKRPGIWPPAVLRIKKQKLTNTQIQKVLNEKRRKYRDKISKTLNRQISISRTKAQKQVISQNVKAKQGLKDGQKESPKRVIYQEKKQEVAPEPKDAVIICISNKDETYQQLKQENYFIGLMLRRKQDPIFKPIDFIKNFIGIVGIEEQDKHLIFCKHQEGKIKYKQLFQRSKAIVRVMGTNIIPGQQKYISAEQQALFLLEIAKKSPQSYAYYTLYKIINYIQFFHDEKITLISAKFLINQLKQLYLLHVYSLKKYQLIKYTWNQETYLHKIAENQNKLLLRSPKVELDTRSRMKSALIQKKMKEQYDQLKISMGLGDVQQNDQQQHKNNSFFAVLHPELPAPIGDLLKDKAMTVQKFQKKYLGYQDKKKSVAVDFNSNLVKTLHKMTPILKAAEGHQIQNRQFPKTASIHSRSAIDKRSFSQGNTISTLNKTTIFL